MEKRVPIKASLDITQEVLHCGRFILIVKFHLDGAQCGLEDGQRARQGRKAKATPVETTTDAAAEPANDAPAAE